MNKLFYTLIIILGLCMVSAVNPPESKEIKTVYTVLDDGVKAKIEWKDQITLSINSNLVKYEDIESIQRSAVEILEQPTGHCFYGDNECEDLPEKCTAVYPYLIPNPCYTCGYEMIDSYPHSGHTDEEWNISCTVYTQAAPYLFTGCTCQDIIVQHGS